MSHFITCVTLHNKQSQAYVTQYSILLGFWSDSAQNLVGPRFGSKSAQICSEYPPYSKALPARWVSFISWFVIYLNFGSPDSSGAVALTIILTCSYPQFSLPACCSWMTDSTMDSWTFVMNVSLKFEVSCSQSTSHVCDVMYPHQQTMKHESLFKLCNDAARVAELTFVTLKAKWSIIYEQHTSKLNWGYKQVNVMVLKLLVFFWSQE